MKFYWLLTNLHEEKSYLITDDTLIGTKHYCDIKIWGINLTENDIRFKTHNRKHICMIIQRPDIRTFKITRNHKQVKGSHIHIYNKNNITIESYLFRAIRIEANEEQSMEETLKNVTIANVQKYREKKKKRRIKSKKLIARVNPNTPALIGTLINEQMTILSTIIDLTGN